MISFRATYIMICLATSCFLNISCSNKSYCTDYSLISDGIETLCIIEQYDEALYLFDTYIKGHPEHYGYVERRVALNLFSHTNRVDDYFLFLERHFQEGGIYKILEYETPREFLIKHAAKIEEYAQRPLDSTMTKKDSLLIEDFLFHDQRIRRDTIMERPEKRIKDSINQLALKGLIAEQKYTNLQLRRGLNLLLRHASVEYLADFKSNGLLDFYVSNGAMTKERYYDAVSYKSADIYFDYDEYHKEETHVELNQKRRKIGLLPIKLSPLKNGKNEIRINLPDDENLRYNYVENEIALYIEEICKQ